MTIGTATVVNALPSASAVAFTVSGPGSGGAVYSPAAVIVPPPSVTDHVTFVSDVPLTDAMNCRVAPESSTPDGPLMTTSMGGGEEVLLAPSPPPPPQLALRTARAAQMRNRVDRNCCMTMSPSANNWWASFACSIVNQPLERDYPCVRGCDA